MKINTGRRDLDKNSFESKEQLGPFFELFLQKAGPEGLGRKNFKFWTQLIGSKQNKKLSCSYFKSWRIHGLI